MESYSLHIIIIIIQLELHWSQPFVLNVGQVPLFVPQMNPKLPKSSNLLLKSALGGNKMVNADSFGILVWIIKDPRGQIARILTPKMAQNWVKYYLWCSLRVHTRSFIISHLLE